MQDVVDVRKITVDKTGAFAYSDIEDIGKQQANAENGKSIHPGFVSNLIRGEFFYFIGNFARKQTDGNAVDQ